MVWEQAFIKAMRRETSLSASQIAERCEAHRQWQAICGFEGIYPNKDMLADDELLITGKMDFREHREYLTQKIHEIYGK